MKVNTSHKCESLYVELNDTENHDTADYLLHSLNRPFPGKTVCEMVSFKSI